MLGPASAAQSYLDVERVVQAAVQARCSALHPGWGFLSENPLLAQLCAQHGVTFVGPPPHVTSLMGSKTKAKATMRAAGLAVIPGSEGVLADAEHAKRVAGGGRLSGAVQGRERRRRARHADRAQGRRGRERVRARRRPRRSAAFGGDRVFLEKLVEGGRHVEIQLFADRYGHAVHLGERDCTVQRNHQKLIEESPSPAIGNDLRAATCELAASGDREDRLRRRRHDGAARSTATRCGSWR